MRLFHINLTCNRKHARVPLRTQVKICLWWYSGSTSIPSKLEKIPDHDENQTSDLCNATTTARLGEGNRATCVILTFPTTLILHLSNLFAYSYKKACRKVRGDAPIPLQKNPIVSVRHCIFGC